MTGLIRVLYILGLVATIRKMVYLNWKRYKFSVLVVVSTKCYVIIIVGTS